MSNSKCNCSFEGELNNQECDTAFWKARCEKAEAEVEQLKAHVNQHCTQEEVAGPQQPIPGLAPPGSLGPIVVSDFTGALPEQLKAHTWQQERAAVVAWLGKFKANEQWVSDLFHAVAVTFERGEHWPEATSVVEQEQTAQETGQYPVEITLTWANGTISHARAKKAYARSDDQYPIKLEGLCVPSVPHSVSEKWLLKWLDASEKFGKQRVPRLDIRTPGRCVTCKDAWVSMYQFSAQTGQVENIEIFGAGWL